MLKLTIIHGFKSERTPEEMNMDKPLVLIVLDGYGYKADKLNNAIMQANTPVWNDLWSKCPHTLISASGLDVGLPEGQMGNSEVGHMTIGAGRVIFQDLTRINRAIATGTFATNPVLLAALNKAKQNKSAVHVLGLLSPGGIHSHEKHIAALLELAQQNKTSPIYLHAFLDGRDTAPQSAQPSLEKFKPYIASIMGRFYAMDRDNRAERTQAAIDLLLFDKAEFKARDPIAGLEAAYARGETDEFVQPTLIKPVIIKPDDVVICMNYRSDRMRQLCHALLKEMPELAASFVTLTEYDSKLPVQIAFPPQQTHDTLSEVISKNNLAQLHIAETEKYPHITFFFNAGKEERVYGEERVVIPSPQVLTYDQKPEMSAQQITDALVAAIENKKYDVIIANYANADMVGHTGNLPATIKAIEVIDQCLGRLVQAAQQFGGELLITSDHGNAETMWDESTKQPHTAHTTNLVPLIYVGKRKITFKSDKTYGLQDIAPTMLELISIKKPEVMTGNSLIAT